MSNANSAAMFHPNSSAWLLATYGNFAWDIPSNETHGLRMIEGFVQTSPNGPTYQITLIRTLVARDRNNDARAALDRLQKLNIGKCYNHAVADLSKFYALLSI